MNASNATMTTKSIDKILSHKGYSVRKASLSFAELKTLKKDLMVTPIAHPDYPFVKTFGVYEDGQQWIRIPRRYGIDRYGDPDRNLLEDHILPDKKFEFKGELRENQLVPRDTALDQLLQKSSGLLCCPTGGGKSVIFLSIMSKLKQRACILVHKSQLLQQWHSEIKRFLPNLRVGIIQQKKKDFSEECDVYLIMIQTLLNMTSVPPIFGLTCIDETHHIASCTFSQILFKVNSKYVMGLTATPDRKDGLTKVIQWHIGDILYQERPDRRNQSTTFVEIYNYFPPRGLDPRKYAEMITKLCDDEERNRYIIDAICEQLRKDPEKKRRMLIMTERKSHAINLYSELRDIYKTERTSGLLLGGMRKDILENEMGKMILVATYNLMSEGISIPQLNTILFATPKRDVVQALGRIFRKTHTDINPMIIDISDSILRGQQAARLKTYNVELNGNIKINYHTMDEMSDEDDDDDEKNSISPGFTLLDE